MIDAPTPLKSYRWAISFAAWFSALSTSWRSTLLTTSNDDRDVEECYQLGANTYIQKPVDLDGLFAAIQRLKDYWFEIALLPKEI